jgi:MarR family 2-MHQ and catechol resistance regulon transcriptional repressor
MGSHYQGDKSDVLALSALINLVRAAESVMGRLNSQFTNVPVSQSQFSVLDSLYHLGPLSQRELGEKLLKTSGNMTMVVDNLEKRELVRRERGERDRRIVTVHLTDKGRETIQSLFPQRAAAIKEEMSILTEAEQDDLRRLCRMVGKKDLREKWVEWRPGQ